MLDFDDRIWPKLLQRVCSEPLATIWFEPIADLARGVAVGYRARPRFPLAGAELSDWMAAAERHGYRARLTAAILSAVLDRRDWLPANAFLLVEMDAAAMHCDAVLALLRRCDDLSAVVFEVVRAESNRDDRKLKQSLGVVREKGGMVALRATGAGHADPLALADLGPQFVKVGAGLIAGIDAHPARAGVLGAIGSLAGGLDAWLIADGIAREAELGVLRRLGVPLGSGPLMGGEREVMMGLDDAARQLLRGSAAEREDVLTALSEPVRTVPIRPELASEVTVVVDRDGRPLEVIVPVGGRRTASFTPLSVQRQDAAREVALRAASRPGGDQLAPVCLCDETGRVTGVIRIEALLEAVARVA